MESIARWIGHSRMSDPAGHAAILADLPPRPDALNDLIQGVLIHADWLSAYGLHEADLGPVSRATLPVAERLTRIFERDSRALDVRRCPAQRSAGTCRDFALLLCSVLRGKGVAARVRCGFADYFGDGWDDHWVCEYWDREVQDWRLSDAQLDEVLRAALRIPFDPTDVPRRSFLTAARAWTECRAGNAGPERFGHGEITGLWFVKVNVIRDHFAISNRETSSWDGWRAAPESRRVVSGPDAALLDEIAARPEQPLVEFDPDWLA